MFLVMHMESIWNNIRQLTFSLPASMYHLRAPVVYYGHKPPSNARACTDCLGTYSTGRTVFSSRAFGPTSDCRSPRGPESNIHHILNSVIGHKHQRETLYSHIFPVLVKLVGGGRVSPRQTLRWSLDPALCSPAWKQGGNAPRRPACSRYPAVVVFAWGKQVPDISATKFRRPSKQSIYGNIIAWPGYPRIGRPTLHARVKQDGSWNAFRFATQDAERILPQPTKWRPQTQLAFSSAFCPELLSASLIHHDRRKNCWEAYDRSSHCLPEPLLGSKSQCLESHDMEHGGLKKTPTGISEADLADRRFESSVPHDCQWPTSCRSLRTVHYCVPWSDKPPGSPTIPSRTMVGEHRTQMESRTEIS